MIFCRYNLSNLEQWLRDNRLHECGAVEVMEPLIQVLTHVVFCISVPGAIITPRSRCLSIKNCYSICRKRLGFVFRVLILAFLVRCVKPTVKYCDFCAAAGVFLGSFLLQGTDLLLTVYI